jgi:hypothetical protein
MQIIDVLRKESDAIVEAAVATLDVVPEIAEQDLIGSYDSL